MSRFGNRSGLLYNVTAPRPPIPTKLGNTVPVSDGTTTARAVAIKVVGGTVSDLGDGVAQITISGSGGGGGSFNIMSLFEINNIQGGGATVCATAPLILNSGNAATCTSPCLYVVGGSA